MRLSIPPRVWFVKDTGLLEGQIFNYYLRKMTYQDEFDLLWRFLGLCLGCVGFIAVVGLVGYLLFEAVEAFARGV